MDKQQTPQFAYEIDDSRSRAGVANPAADPLQRIEQQLADLIHIVESLQRRLDSIDVTLARLSAR